jgi:hypothetical protein
MSDERQYAAVEVVGRAAGMNQSGWEGAIADNQCSMLHNMGTNIDGEWSKRKGYTKRKEFQVSAAAPTMKLHWHTDVDSDQANGSTWVETGDEITAASSGALDTNDVYATANSALLDGEWTGSINNYAVDSAIGIKSSFNLLVFASV